jgi:4-phospho-D-threonate 3-dehydrogenase / 4-phospho-D-erythronate 3-dehydrogenase
MGPDNPEPGRRRPAPRDKAEIRARRVAACISPGSLAVPRPGPSLVPLAARNNVARPWPAPHIAPRRPAVIATAIVPRRRLVLLWPGPFAGTEAPDVTPPTLAISTGDPAGIGPEIIMKAVRRLGQRLGHDLRLVLVGEPGILAAAAREAGLPVPPGDGSGAPVTILPTLAPLGPIRVGEVTAEGGRQAHDAVVRATELAMEGRARAIVTAPLSKEALHLAGHDFAGHTELLAALTGARDSAMMLAHGAFRVSHATTHVALEDVPRRLTRERIARVVELTRDALLRLGLAEPRIAVAALNPHAGEGGIFGRHDIDVTAPLVAELRGKGWHVTGPVPGDTVFVKLRGGAYDAVVAMYHDQGHIPVKLLGFSVDPATGRWTALSGVNVTLGLPIVRTSVDHGTAFDIAGQGVAEEGSMLEAIDMALELSAG